MTTTIKLTEVKFHTHIEGNDNIRRIDFDIPEGLFVAEGNDTFYHFAYIQDLNTFKDYFMVANSEDWYVHETLTENDLTYFTLSCGMNTGALNYVRNILNTSELYNATEEYNEFWAEEIASGNWEEN